MTTCKTPQKEFFKNIEFFRILLAISIIIYHLFVPAGILPGIAPESSLYIFFQKTAGLAGYSAVDLFFIISGFLLIMTINTKLSVIEFLQKKFIRLFPVIFFMFVFSFILHELHIEGFNKYTNLLSLFFMNNIGWTVKKGLAGTWFISVLVAVSTFYFYIIKHFAKKYSDLIIVLCVLFSYSFLIHALNGSIDRGLMQWNYVFSAGTMRGLAGIGIGIGIGNLYKEYSTQIKAYQETFWSKIIYSALEVYLFGYVFYNLVFHKIKNNDIMLILAFTILFWLFIIKRGWLSKLFECNLSVNLGKYAYALFLVHLHIINILNFIIWKSNPQFVINHPGINLLLPLGISIICAIIIYHAVEKPGTKLMKQIFYGYQEAK